MRCHYGCYISTTKDTTFKYEGLRICLNVYQWKLSSFRSNSPSIPAGILGRVVGSEDGRVALELRGGGFCERCIVLIDLFREHWNLAWWFRSNANGRRTHTTRGDLSIFQLSGEKTTASACNSGGSMSCPVFDFQTRTVPSWLPEAIYRLSGEKETEYNNMSMYRLPKSTHTLSSTAATMRPSLERAVCTRFFPTA